MLLASWLFTFHKIQIRAPDPVLIEMDPIDLTRVHESRTSGLPNLFERLPVRFHVCPL